MGETGRAVELETTGQRTKVQRQREKGGLQLKEEETKRSERVNEVRSTHLKSLLLNCGSTELDFKGKSITIPPYLFYYSIF